MKVLFLFIYLFITINTNPGGVEKPINNNNENIEFNKTQRNTEENSDEKNKLLLEKEQFNKQIEIFTLSDFTTFELPSKSGEFVYYKGVEGSTMKFAFYLSNEEKIIHFKFSGPDGKGASKVYQTFTNKNFLYYEHKVVYPGQYTFYLDNGENSDISEVSFAVKDDLKEDKNIGMQKLDTISEYLDDIDEKINKLRLKQNMINKKTEAHNDSVNKHNREILIYSLAEVGTMVLILVGQLFYIKSKVDKI